MSKLKQIVRNPRVLILLIALVLSLLFIQPQFSTEGVAIRSIVKDSAAENAAPLPFVSPDPGAKPTSREVLLSLDGQEINSIADYYAFQEGLEANQTVLAKTNSRVYRLTTQPLIQTTVLDELEEVEIVESVFNNETNTTENVTTKIEQNKVLREVIGVEDLGLIVYERPNNNIAKGLDLEGGTRVLLSLESQLSEQDLNTVLDTIRQRLNVFGVSDVIVRSVRDFTGEVYVLVEIAGASQEEVRELLSQQGKFEAKVANTTVFTGGDDVRYVCRSADCSGIDPQRGCFQHSQSGWTCNFFFNIALSLEAAERQAEATRNLPIVDGGTGQTYLSENLSLFLDNELVDELAISAGLRGNVVTDITISGNGEGVSRAAAEDAAIEQMKNLQTVLITGSLPVKLEIIQSDAVSPALGEEFLDNAVFIGLLAMAAVAVIILIRYRKPVTTIPTIIAMLSEVIIILGFAALIGWRLDLAAIAGIIIAVGSGVDDQIVIIDETLSKRASIEGKKSWKEKMAKAFFIIMTAYFTTVVAMLPLWFSGAGLLKGFALTTIIGVSVGVLITRPAFARIIEILYGKN